jgi:hypothetical protein
VNARRVYSDRYVVRTIEGYLDEEKGDCWLGLKTRLLMEERADELRGRGVIELPDDN